MRGRRLLLAGAMVLLLSLAVPAALSGASPLRASPLFVPRSFGLGPAAPRTSAFYLQEGATIVAENGSASTMARVLQANLTVPSSPYATGYELNGLSDSGDWYQALVADNWPGCASGLGFAYEIWDATGATAAPSCALGVPLSAGDTVSLSIELNCAAAGAGSYCLTFADLTTGLNATASGAQPDAGGTGFVNLAVPADANGYFTGPMTEVVDTSASACLRYTSLPTVDYVLGNVSLAPTAYVPWSDEFQVTNSGTASCYVHNGVLTDVAGTPQTVYTDASGGSAYGPHWVASQNWSAVPGTAGGWRFQTDAVPLRATLSLSRTTADVGQTVLAAGNASGGVAPYTCAWSTGGAFVNGPTCTTTFTIQSVGSNPIQAYLIDSSLDYALAQANVNATVGPTLQLAASAASIVLGNSLTLTPTIAGGLAPFTVSWSGLPPGCAASAGAGNVSCTPTAAGTFLVIASATDANGGTAHSVILVTVDAGILGAPTAPVVILIIAVLIVAVVLVFLLLARPRRKEPAQAPPFGPTPPPPAPPTPPSQGPPQPPA